MEIVKVLNNSTVIALEQNQQVVVMGKGLSFGKKAGDEVQVELIEKKFSLDTNQQNQQLAHLLNSVPIQCFELAKDIIDIAVAELGVTLNESLYLTLTDHINFALTRYQNGVQLSNALLAEIKILYPKEFAIGMQAIRYINIQAQTVLTEDEAGFLALHIVNARDYQQGENTSSEMEKLVQDIVSLIQTYYQIDLSKDALNYSRLMTHLKYFSLRLQKGDDSTAVEQNMFEMVVEKYPEAYSVMGPINHYLEKNYETTLSDSEAMYLTMHVNRLLDRKKIDV